MGEHQLRMYCPTCEEDQDIVNRYKVFDPLGYPHTHRWLECAVCHKTVPKDSETMRPISVELPKGFMNVGITKSNWLIADTNDSENWDTLSFPLPLGRWVIKKIDGKVVHLVNKGPE